jgi:curved DNA-binding protein
MRRCHCAAHAACPWHRQENQTMEFKDYYKTLGIERSASEADIKKAYRKLARKHHPDVSKAPDAQARMQEVNEAYEVLHDPARRAAYDRVGEGWQGGQEFHPPPDWDAQFESTRRARHGGHAGDAHDDFSAFFESLFGGAQRGGAGRPAGAGGFQARGEDHHARISIPLEDAFHGARRTLTLQGEHVDAAGRVVMRERQLDVNIPRGMRAGQQIRLAGQGSPGLGGGPGGDLYLEVQFEPHPRWRVDGRDLYLTLPVAPWEAALGATVPVATPGGTVEMTVPAGSQTGRKLRLKGRGIPGVTADAAPGDLYVVLEVRLPPADTDKAQALYRQMARDLPFDPRRDLEG